jgi:hypothetical protein
VKLWASGGDILAAPPADLKPLFLAKVAKRRKKEANKVSKRAKSAKTAPQGVSDTFLG